MTSIQRLGVLAHPLRPETAPIAEKIAETFQTNGLEVWVHKQWTETELHTSINGTDMIIAIGGDGAMLRAARCSAPFAVPVLGVNMGYLGFLTEIRDPNDCLKELDRILAGDYWVERRMMLEVTAYHDDQPTQTSSALNDVVISRGPGAHVIQLATYIDGVWTTTYNADGLVIATATGSTAYALAAGGPILPPELHNMVVVPVAPHLTLDRPIVLPDGATIDVVVTRDRGTESTVSADGISLCTMCEGDRISVRSSDHVSQFVRLRDRNYFYRSLLDRLEPRVAPPNRHDS
ncbi:MAG: NAD(+)/NADH kinase [Chloroflexi bacterium]|nr:NAD(+)/NADH kinase [Chloroflexota bacterium]